MFQYLYRSCGDPSFQVVACRCLGVGKDHYGILAHLGGECYSGLFSCIRVLGQNSRRRQCRPLVVCDANREGATSRILGSVHLTRLWVITVVVPDVVYPGEPPSSVMFRLHVAGDPLNFQAFSELRSYLALMFVVGF